MEIHGEPAYAYIKNSNYYITKSGKIYSTYVVGGQGKTDATNPHLLRYGQDKDGYYRVVLSYEGKKRYAKVHTIMVEQFIGDVPNGMVINHIDGDKHNNNIDNLEIVTVQYNNIHAHNLGLCQTDQPVEVHYQGLDYVFPNMKRCSTFFPDLSRNYLHQLKNGLCLFTMIQFKKQNPELRIGPIDSYYNGQLYKTFSTFQEADNYFGKKRGWASAACSGSNEYRTRVNQYTVTFPNVSTIESTQ